MLITDTMAQVAAWAAASENGLDVVAGLVALREAKFRRYVRPGDQMVVETELVRHLGERTVWKAKALVDNKVIASIKELEFILTSLSPEAARLERQRFIYCGGDEKLLSNAVPA